MKVEANYQITHLSFSGNGVCTWRMKRFESYTVVQLHHYLLITLMLKCYVTRYVHYESTLCSQCEEQQLYPLIE